MYYCIILLQVTVLLSYVANILYATLQIAAKVLIHYMHCYKKLYSNGVMHSTIVLLVIKDRALHKGHGL